MSYSLSVSADALDLADALTASADKVYPGETAAPGVRDQIDRSIEVVDTYLSNLEENGKFSAALSGHVKQGEDDQSRSAMSISVYPTT